MNILNHIGVEWINRRLIKELYTPLIISTAHKDRAFKFYSDLGTEEPNKI